jgi:hypothetical protein
MLIGFFTRIGCHYDPYSLGKSMNRQAHALPLPALQLTLRFYPGIYIISTLVRTHV